MRRLRWVRAVLPRMGFLSGFSFQARRHAR